MAFIRLTDQAIALFTFAFVVVAGMGAYSYHTSSRSLSLSEWVNHTSEIISEIRGISLALQTAESTQRDHLLIRHPELLKTLRDSISQIEPYYQRLINMTADNSLQQRQLGALRPLLLQRIGQLQQSVSARQLAEAESEDSGVALGRRIQSVFDQMEDQEHSLLRSRLAIASLASTHSQNVILYSSLCTFLILVAAAFVLMKELNLRKVAIAERMAAEHKAIQALDARAVFVANMSHEFRTPLHSIVGMTEVLSDCTDPQERSRCLAIIKRAGSLLVNLVNDVLDLSKIEAGKLHLEDVPYNSRELLQHTIEMVAFRASEKDLDLSFEVTDDVPINLCGDPNRLRQVLLNLLGNAIKFTEKGFVAITVETKDLNTPAPLLLLTVKDTGPGITPDRYKLIFNRFARTDPSIATQEGSGLGLTITKELVELMRGRIWFDSQPGQGTSFFVKLPMKDAGASVQPVARKEEARDLRPLRILVADDLEENRLLVQLYLRHLPYRLVFVQNGGEAVEAFLAEEFDVVLMDMHMPKMNGYEAVHKIREEEKKLGTTRVPIMALTAFGVKEDAAKSKTAGCDRHLVKPITRESLEKAIREATVDIQLNASPASGRHLIYLTHDLKPLVPGFLNNLNKQLEQIAIALQSADFTAASGVAHTIKGVAGTFGFSVVSELARNIEGAIKLSEAEKAQALHQEAVAYLKNADIIFI